MFNQCLWLNRGPNSPSVTSYVAVKWWEMSEGVASRNAHNLHEKLSTMVQVTFWVRSNLIKMISLKEQAGTELDQAQLQLELGFTLIKVCCIILMITNYHYISLSTISVWTWLLLLTCILACLIAIFHACLLTYFPISRLSTSYLLAIYGQMSWERIFT